MAAVFTMQVMYADTLLSEMSNEENVLKDPVNPVHPLKKFFLQVFKNAKCPSNDMRGDPWVDH